ncbi:MAG: serine acetyltransferase [Lentisphaeria bacterium]|nr:serine acetyltransferase [Lentisphaeria bacterium]NQZ68230.1 serine acetyltransferase [Lentisphaeria bacterium]
MIARLLIKPFGSVWSLKEKSVSGSGFAKLLYGLYQYENNSSIAWNSSFKSEPCFPHGMKSIFISGAAQIGHNCVIFQQVTIGSVTLPDAKSKGFPILGDNVYVGSGAKIVGAVKIGNNVRIGANAVVYKDVPDNCVVVSAEQKIIEKDEPLDNRFYSWQKKKWVYFDKGTYHEVTDAKIIDSLEQKPDSE